MLMLYSTIQCISLLNTFSLQVSSNINPSLSIVLKLYVHVAPFQLGVRACYCFLRRVECNIPHRNPFVKKDGGGYHIIMMNISQR